jgi:hypothetical protein
VAIAHDDDLQLVEQVVRLRLLLSVETNGNAHVLGYLHCGCGGVVLAPK